MTLRDSALATAAERDREAVRGPLHGVPFTIKESLDCRGSATTYGVPALRDALPYADAPAVARLRAAGRDVRDPRSLDVPLVGPEPESREAARGPIANRAAADLTRLVSAFGAALGQRELVTVGIFEEAHPLFFTSRTEASVVVAVNHPWG